MEAAKADKIPANSHLVYFIRLLRCGERGAAVGAVNEIKEAGSDDDDEMIGVTKAKNTGFIHIRGKNPGTVSSPFSCHVLVSYPLSSLSLSLLSYFLSYPLFSLLLPSLSSLIIIIQGR